MTATPFFVVGCDRSGTTMFRLMLDRHPDIGIPLESRFLASILDAFGPDSTLSAADLDRLETIVRDDPRWPYWEVSDDDLSATLAAGRDGGWHVRDAVDAVNRLGISGERRWGDKNPPYLFETARLSALYPSAKFIHVIRDGRDVALSLRNAGWRGRVTSKTAAYWRDCIEEGRRAHAALGPDRYLEVRYEDLVSNAEDVLRASCAFLDEQFHPQMLEFHETAAANVAGWEAEIHAKTKRQPTPQDLQRWRTEMPITHLAVFEQIAGPAMDLVGQQRHLTGIRRMALPAAALALRLEPKLRPLRRRAVKKESAA